MYGSSCAASLRTKAGTQGLQLLMLLARDSLANLNAAAEQALHV